MKKNIIFFLLFIAIQINVQAQVKLDSLETLLESEIHDTVRFNTLLALELGFVRKNPDKSIAYFNQLLVLSEQIGKEDKLAKAYQFLGISYVMKDYGLDTILQAYEKSLELAEKNNQIGIKVNVLNNLALTYRKFGQQDKAFAILQDALVFIKKEGLRAEGVLTYANCAAILKDQGSLEMAKGYYLKALVYAEEINNIRFIGMLSNNLADFYEVENLTDSALFYYNKSLSIKRKINDEFGMIMTLSNIGQIYTGKKKYDLAYQYYQDAYQLTKQNQDSHSHATFLLIFSNFYSEQEKYKEAIGHLNESLDVLGNNGDITIKVNCYNSLSFCYEAIGKYKEAYKYSKLYQTLNDSIFTLDKDEQIKSLEIQYKVEQKETENKLLKAETEVSKKQTRNRTYVAIGLIILLLLVLSWSYFISKANQQKKKANEILEAKVKERTKDLEQANYELRTFNYIASHDIKEPIRVIGGYAGLVYKKLPNDLKESLGDYFELIKRSTNQLYTLVEDFSNYLSMSKNETIEKQAVDLNQLIIGVIDNIKETVDKSNGQVLMSNLPTIQSSNSLLFTTFKNLIENGLKYNNSDNPVVNVDYQKTTNTHQIIISDNGIGIEKQYQEQIFEMFKRLHNRGEYEGSGIGLAIVKLSTEKLDGTVTLDSDLGKGSRFLIELPILEA